LPHRQPAHLQRVERRHGPHPGRAARRVADRLATLLVVAQLGGRQRLGHQRRQAVRPRLPHAARDRLQRVQLGGAQRRRLLGAGESASRHCRSANGPAGCPGATLPGRVTVISHLPALNGTVTAAGGEPAPWSPPPPPPPPPPSPRSQITPAIISSATTAAAA